VTVTEAGATCGGWTAATDGTGTLALTGAGTPIDGLRALTKAAWSVHDKRGGLDHAQVAAALDQLAAKGLRIG
jgi:glycerol-1-phosphatase